jgi:transcription elongation factor Elf1
MRTELEWAVRLPVPCPACGEETLETVAELSSRGQVICPQCRGLIDIRSDAWRAYVREFAQAVAKVQALYQGLP